MFSGHLSPWKSNRKVSQIITYAETLLGNSRYVSKAEKNENFVS
jgi:hypothetical protein